MTIESQNTLLLDENWEKAHQHLSGRMPWRIIIATLLGLTVVGTVLSIVRINGIVDPARQLKSYSPASSVVSEIPTQFDGAFMSRPVYKGKPSPALDRAWDKLTQIKYIPLSEDEVRTLGKDPKKAVKFPPDIRLQEKPFAGFLEVFHQLHCLNTVRQYLDAEHYKTHFPGSPVENRMHVDHCIDILRQFIMCQADIGVVTMNWVTFMDNPTPDFSTHHICRDFGQVRAWNEEYSMRWVPFQKTNDSVELDHYP